LNISLKLKSIIGQQFGIHLLNFDLYKKEIMNALENIKNSLIDRILATRNEKLLEAIKGIFDSTQSEEIISLSTEQIEMLSMSEKDIEYGKLVSESELSKRDSKWLS
jgi:hypothetical protein